MLDRLIAVMFTSKCLLLLGKKELEDNPSSRHVEDVCIKLRASITPQTGVPYELVECGISSLTGHPNETHLLVSLENIGSVEMHRLVRDLYLELIRQKNESNITGLNPRRPYVVITENCHTNIWIAMGFVGDYLTGEWPSAYGSATAVMQIAKAICSKYDKMASTEKISGLKNFTCVVSGPHLGHLEGEFVLQFELDKVDVVTLTKEGLEKRNQEGTGYEIAYLQLKDLNAAS